MRKTKLLFMFLLLTQLLWGQSNLRFERLYLGETISENVVDPVLQDSRGYMWFGTNNGLFRFDGYNMTKFEHIPGDSSTLAGNSITCLAESKTGGLWIGTINGGISRYDFVQEQFTTYRPRWKISGSLSSSKISCLYVDFYNYLWIGTSSNGLNVLNLNDSISQDPEKAVFLHFTADNSTGLLHNAVNYITGGSNHTVWIATATGINRLALPQHKLRISKNDFRFIDFLQDSIIPLQLRDDEVISLMEDSKQRLWFNVMGSYIARINIDSKELVIWTNKTQGFENLDVYPLDSSMQVEIRSFAEDSHGNIWLQSSFDGLLRYRENQEFFDVFLNEQYNENSINSNTVNTMCQSNTGMLWFSTNKGIAKLKPSQKYFTTYSNRSENSFKITAESIRSIYEDEKGTLWVGGYFGLDKIDRKNGTITPLADLILQNTPTLDVFTIAQDKENPDILWLGREGNGLIKFDTKEQTVKNITRFFSTNPDYTCEHFVFEILADANYTLWIGHHCGLTMLNTSSYKYLTYTHKAGDNTSLGKGAVKSIFKDNNGTLWVGTDAGGVNKFDPETNSFTRFQFDKNDTTSISHNKVLCIFQDRAGLLWIGTVNGLNRFDTATETFTRYTTDNGLADNTIYGIFEDKRNNLWFSTNNGITKFNPVTGDVFNFNKEDGLQDNEFNTGAFFQNKKGEIFFGGIKGLTVFHPDSIRYRYNAPKTIITGMKLFNKPVKPGKMPDGRVLLLQSVSLSDYVELNYDDQFFSFDFAALEFEYPDDIHFAFMLEGLHNDWIITDASHRTASFSGLPPNTYTLHVRASRDLKNWGEQAILTIKITPPFYKTWWFRIITVLFLIFSIISFVRWLFQSLKLQKIKLEKIVLELTLEIKQQNEEIFFQSEQLIITNEKSKELDRHKQNLTQMIVHDLKNPLSTIIGLSVNQNVKHAANKMLNLVMNILDVQHSEDSYLQPEMENCLLREMINNAIEQIRVPFEQKSITVQNTICSTCLVSADEEMIIRVFVNLLTNAVKHTPLGGNVSINCQQMPAPENGEYVKISVSDTGEGISEDRLKNIFEKYEHGKNPKNRRLRSTGLGLTFCKLVVEAHKGKIYAESVYGAGATFYLSLPSAGKARETDSFADTLVINGQSINLAETERQLLNSSLKKLRATDVYDLSVLKEIISQIDGNQSENISEWLKKLENAIFSCNEAMYNELINI